MNFETLLGRPAPERRRAHATIRGSFTPFTQTFTRALERVAALSGAPSARRRGLPGGAAIALALVGALLAGAQPAAAQSVAAQTWPSRPVKIVVPLGAGATLDIGARLLATALAERLKQPVVVENRPGASMATGITAVVNAAPDGYTLLYVGTALAITPALYKVAFDPVNDLVPVTQVVENHLEFVVRAGLPVSSVADVVALARAKPGTLTCGLAGGLPQMGCELFRSTAGIDIAMVPYKSIPQALADMSAGTVDMVFSVGKLATPFVESGRVKLLATSGSRRRSAAANALPSMSDTVRGFVLKGWEGVLVPAGTPGEIVARLHGEFAAILADPEIRRRLSELGADPVSRTSDEFRRVIAADVASFAKLVRDAGIKAD
jgi:tripartite-type tricarboxylate transporter receptor subunit TctC